MSWVDLGLLAAIALGGVGIGMELSEVVGHRARLDRSVDTLESRTAGCLRRVNALEAKVDDAWVLPKSADLGPPSRD